MLMLGFYHRGHENRIGFCIVSQCFVEIACVISVQRRRQILPSIGSVSLEGLNVGALKIRTGFL